MVESEDAEAHRELGMGFFFLSVCCAVLRANFLCLIFAYRFFFCLSEMLLLSLKIA
jgi:hypothetical protein